MTVRTRLRAAAAGLALLALAGCSSTVVDGKGEYAAPYPVVEKGFSDVGAGVAVKPPAGATSFDGTKGLLLTPHGGLQQTSVLVTKSLDELSAQALQVGSKGMTAPPGQELVVATFDATDIKPMWANGTDLATYRYVVGSTPTEVDLNGTYNADLSTWSQPTSGLVVSVPIGSPVRMQIVDEGKSASLDLRTGGRADDAGTKASTVLYGDHFVAKIGKPYEAAGAVVTSPPPGIVAETITYALPMDFSDAYAQLSPWSPADGWAPDGKAWLFVAGVTITTPKIGPYGVEKKPGPVDLTMSIADTYTFTPAGQQAVKAQPRSLEIDGAYAFTDPTGNGEGAAFLVPAATTTGTLSVAPNGTFVVPYSDGDVPAAWSTAPAPYTTTIDLKA